MVARLGRLRLALLRSAFRGTPSQLLRRLLGALLALVVAVALALLPQLMSTDAQQHAAIDTVLLSVVLSAAILVPLFASRKLLDPRQFAHFPVSSKEIASSMLVTTVLSWSALWLLVWAGALLVIRAEWHAVWWAAAIGALLILGLAVLLTRVASALGNNLIAPHHAGTVRAVGVLLLVAATPVVVFAVAQALGSPDGMVTRDTAQVLGWTPLGAPVAGIALAAAGDSSGALLRFGLAALAILLLALVWFALVRVSVESIERPQEVRVARTGLGWFERFPATPAGVIGARALTYWARDPRYRVSLAAIPLAPILMVVAFWIAGAEPELLALVPLPVILMLLGWSAHNDVATDSTAVWLHVASGTRGRDDRLGRLTPVLLFGLPIVLVGSSITVTVMGDWRVLPAVIGMNLSVLLVAAGVASVGSALAPYPTTRPGDSPFAQPAVAGTGSGVAQTVSILAVCVFALPPIWIAVSAITDVSFGLNILALLLGAGYGLLVIILGVWIGGKLFDRAAPELLAATQTFD